jgi:hypothetical protein
LTSLRVERVVGDRDVAGREHADADDHEVALERAPVAGPDALDRGVSLEGLDAGPHQHPDAVVEWTSR